MWFGMMQRMEVGTSMCPGSSQFSTVTILCSVLGFFGFAHDLDAGSVRCVDVRLFLNTYRFSSPTKNILEIRYGGKNSPKTPLLNRHTKQCNRFETA
jgi:hypothetical protein